MSKPLAETPPMRDVQSGPAEVPLAIDRVGVGGLRLPLTMRDRAQGSQATVARIDLSVDLPAAFKGTHMSRFVEALEQWSGELSYDGVRHLLADVRQRLDARSAHARLQFPYFVRRSAPVSAGSGLMDYDCLVEAESWVGDKGQESLRLTVGVDVPVMTVCPCSLAISDTGAHSQRAVVRIRARFTGFVWLEELIQIAEEAGSSPVYSLLKREDEKYVTEAAFARPTFVEDVIRAAAQALERHPRITWYRVEVESFESIHNHSAQGSLEKTKAAR